MRALISSFMWINVEIVFHTNQSAGRGVKVLRGKFQRNPHGSVFKKANSQTETIRLASWQKLAVIKVE